LGDHSGARSELEAAFRHWSSTRRTYLGLDDRVLVGLGLARILWVQGFPAKAAERARQTLKDAKLSSNPASLAVTLSWIPAIFICVGDLRSAEEHVDWLISHADEPKDGRKLLQPILELFVEGRDTADLQTAQRLLAELVMIKISGGSIGSNPEQLFAAAWSASFESAIALAARNSNVTLGEVMIDAELDPHLVDGTDYFLRARLNISIRGVDRTVAQDLVQQAEQLCPYSKATRANIDVTLDLLTT
jgi:Ohr subfamily peroxiredoxin